MVRVGVGVRVGLVRVFKSFQIHNWIYGNLVGNFNGRLLNRK